VTVAQSFVDAAVRGRRLKFKKRFGDTSYEHRLAKDHYAMHGRRVLRRNRWRASQRD
jgi:hypothetical protein